VILDFGCGAGEWVEDPVRIRSGFRNLKGKAKRVIGLDADPAASRNPSVDEFRPIGDGSDWPIVTDSIDLLICDNVLEHLANPAWFFSEARRVTRSSGYLCIRTPNKLSYVGLISRIVPNRWHRNLKRLVQSNSTDPFPTFYHCNTVWRLRRLMTRYGFDGIVYGYEPEPGYLSFTKAAYATGVLHQRLAPGFLRCSLLAFGSPTKQS
jgi:SAM-dependent methyltransferase